MFIHYEMVKEPYTVGNSDDMALGCYLKMREPFYILSQFLSEPSFKLAKYKCFLEVFVLSNERERMEMIQKNAWDEDWLLSSEFSDIADGELFIFEEQSVVMAFVRPIDNKLFLINKWHLSTINGKLESHVPLELSISDMIKIIDKCTVLKNNFMEENNAFFEGVMIL